jgi:hypothetical protein
LANLAREIDKQIFEVRQMNISEDRDTRDCFQMSFDFMIEPAEKTQNGCDLQSGSGATPFV